MTNELLEAALAYAERGWPVFPCRADKAPLTENGVLDASTDPRTIEAWWAEHPRANIGCNVGAAGLVVLDFDPGSDRTELERNIGPIPDTGLRQRTPRGGLHLFLELGEGEIVSPSSSKLAPHVDVRSFNSYVLLAPSRTSDGAYSWDADGRPAFRTDEMVRVANAHREKHADRDRWIIDADLPENIDAAVDWLKHKAKPAVMGHGGDHTAYATAAMMKSYGISEELARDLMWEHWNPRCSPPWTADEIEHFEAKVRNGHEYNTSPPGNVTPAYRAAASQAVFKPVRRDGLSPDDNAENSGAEGGLEAQAGRFRFIDRRGLDFIPPVSWLIQDTIPVGGFAFLYGPPGSFKTFIALDMALSVATGAGWPWAGPWGLIGQKGPVLFAAGEGRSGIGQRVTAWEKLHWEGRQVPTSDFILGDPVPRAAEEYDAFIAGAKAFSPMGYKLVVIDTLGRSMRGLNENSSEDAGKFNLMVEALQRELNAAVLVIAHDAKSSKGSDSSVRGSGAFEGDADVAIRCEKLPKGKLVSLSMTKQKDADAWPKPRVIKLAVVQLGEDQSSLACSLPDEADLKAGKSSGSDAEAINLEILSEVLARLLASNKVKAWSSAEMADTIALDERIDVGSHRIRNHYLKTLREDKASAVRHYYEGATRRWRWSD